MRELCRPAPAAFRCLYMMISLLFLSPWVFPQAPAARPQEEDRRQKRLDVQINHLVDLEYMVRKIEGLVKVSKETKPAKSQ